MRRVMFALVIGVGLSGCMNANQRSLQQAWEYYCIEGNERTPEAMAKAGAAGWELAAAANSGSQSTWCFKRPRQN